jgi:hypothetical protein
VICFTRLSPAGFSAAVLGVLGAVAALVLILPSSVAAQVPDDSSIDQYVESVPDAGGDNETSGPGTGGGGAGGGGGGGAEPGSGAGDGGESTSGSSGSTAPSDSTPEVPVEGESPDTATGTAPGSGSDAAGADGGSAGVDPPAGGQGAEDQSAPADDDETGDGTADDSIEEAATAASEDPSVGSGVVDALRGDGEMGLALPILLIAAAIAAIATVAVRLRRRGTPTE